MRHAFIITAYKDFEFIKKTVEVYLQEADCYIHVDKKVEIPAEFMEWANNTDGVFVYSKYKINWGSYKHISAILYLMKMALKNGEYSYFHVISANSFINRSMQDVVRFFEESGKKNFLEVVDLDEDDKERVIEPWYIYYHFLHLYDKRTKFGNNFDWYFCKVQKRLGIRRKTTYKYKGLVYCHLTKEAVEYVLQYVKKNRGYLRNLKMCNIGEEFFFQNILMYSPFKASVYPSHLFYTKWNEGGVAQFLMEEDWEEIMDEKYLFVRKFGERSEGVFERICKEIGVKQ